MWNAIDIKSIKVSLFFYVEEKLRGLQSCNHFCDREILFESYFLSRFRGRRQKVSNHIMFVIIFSMV